MGESGINICFSDILIVFSQLVLCCRLGHCKQLSQLGLQAAGQFNIKCKVNGDWRKSLKRQIIKNKGAGLGGWRLDGGDGGDGGGW